MGLKRLRIRPDFRMLQTSDGLSMIEVICQLPDTERDIVLSAADAPYIRDDEASQVEEFLAASVHRVNGAIVSGAEGLICAKVHGTLAMSLLSDAQWDAALVTISVIRDGCEREETSSVLHASRKPHLATHSAKIGELAFDPRVLTATPTNPLPNSTFVTRYIAKDDWQSLVTGIMAKADGEKIAAITTLATAVAKANGYVSETKLSTYNQQRRGSYRQIFSTGEGASRLFLSTDVKKCTYEVCAYNGQHLGEWRFSGTQHQAPDTSGKHDIDVI